MELNPVFYNMVIDPLLKSQRSRIVAHIKPGMKVLDIACGTGKLAHAMALAGGDVTGIDLDPSMISYSKTKRNGIESSRLSFVQLDAQSMVPFEDHSFHLSTMSLALHQFPPAAWNGILHEIFRVSGELLIADYHFPLPDGAKKNLVYFIERIAGKEHSQNFRAFMEAGGVVPIVEAAGYACIHHQRSGSGIFGLYRII